MVTQQEAFLTFEQELRRLAELSSAPLPPLTQGAWAFFGGMTGWLGRPEMNILLPDPSLNLSLPYAREEISLALAFGLKRQATQEEVENHAEQYGLLAEHLDRPIVSLSGGERMLLSVGKLAAIADSTRSSVICSPFFWLDPSNHQYVFKMLKKLESFDFNPNLLLLEGEIVGGSKGSDAGMSAVRNVEWSLRIDDLQVTYPDQSFPRPTVGKSIRFQSDEETISFVSPAIMTGTNGIGKTSLAKILANLMVPSQGSIDLIVLGRRCEARIVLQDPLMHLFSLRPTDHLARVFGHDSTLKNTALEMYGKSKSRFMSGIRSEIPDFDIGGTETETSILQSKLALAVERLVTPSGLLILDEPAWCLSRPVARHFLRVISELAHELGKAVLIISHQHQWWNGIAGSEMSLSGRDGRITVGSRTIQL